MVAVSNEPFALAAVAAVVAIAAVVAVVALSVAVEAPSLEVVMMEIVDSLSVVLRNVFGTSMREGLAADAMALRRPCWLLLPEDVAGIVVIWMQRCCHACAVDCTVGRRAIPLDANRVGIVDRFCLA